MTKKSQEKMNATFAKVPTWVNAHYAPPPPPPPPPPKKKQKKFIFFFFFYIILFFFFFFLGGSIFIKILINFRFLSIP